MLSCCRSSASQFRPYTDASDCRTNPRLRDNPIVGPCAARPSPGKQLILPRQQVLASEGFASLTGYSTAEIIGRNCRFLQGPSTAPSSVLGVREALRRGEGHTSLLLNCRSAREVARTGLTEEGELSRWSTLRQLQR